jgi:hypothetical protein
VGKLNEKMKEELKLLFYALCDGLRQEMRQRNLANLATGEDFSLVNEREQGIASSLAGHLRLIGFSTQVESYFAEGSPKRRPDFRIWLPPSRKYIYLELKQTAWGKYSKQYYYGNAIKEIKKLADEKDQRNQLNGLIALGFSYETEKLEGRLWEGFKKLSQNITNAYPYEEIGLEAVDFQGTDKQTSYAVIGLWFRKE